MLDLGWPEMLVIAIVLIVVVGPKDLPKMLRSFGRASAKIRAMAGDFRKQFDDALKEAELDELKTLATEARKLNPASELKKAMSPMERAAQDVKAGLDAAMKPARAAEAPAVAETASAPPAPAATPAPSSAAPQAAPAATPAAQAPAAAASRPIPEPVGAKRAAAAAAAARGKAKPSKSISTRPARTTATAAKAAKKGGTQS